MNEQTTDESEILLYPDKLPKPKLDNLQDHLDYLNKYEKGYFEVSVKLNGIPGIFFLDEDNELVMCNRDNVIVSDEEDNIHTTIAEQYNVQFLLDNYDYNIALFGEIVGPGIKDNPEQLDEIRYYIYDVYDMDIGRYYLPGGRREIFKDLDYLAAKYNDQKLLHIPLLDNRMKLFHQFSTMKLLKWLVKGPSIKDDVLREGLVFKSCSDHELRFKLIDD